MLSEDNPDSGRPYDVIIFGASGSVGKFLVEEMALVVDKHHSKSDKCKQVNKQGNHLDEPKQNGDHRKLSVPNTFDKNVKWAIAGRSAMKLNETLGQAELSTGIQSLSSQVPVLLADLNQHRSLLDLCSKTRVIINCVGPYSVDGEALVKACLRSGTNYLDLAHETTFIDRVRLKYHRQAQAANVCIINGCGFQSMSAEMGLNFIKNVVNGQIEEVRIILNLSDTSSFVKSTNNRNESARTAGIVSRGMWASLLAERSQPTDQAGKRYSRDDVDHAADATLSEEKKKLLVRKDTQTLVRDVVVYRNRYPLRWFQLFDNCFRKFCLPINSLTSDEAQLIRGEMTNYEIRKPDLNNEGCWKPIRCTNYIAAKSFIQTVILFTWLFLFNLLVKFSMIRRLMSSFPNVFSLNFVYNGNRLQLNRDSINHVKYSQTFLVYGVPGSDSSDPLEERNCQVKRNIEQLLVVRIVGPEPNHIATASYAVQASLAVVLERDHLPPSGGVLTPGVAFADTNIIYQLKRRNIKFEVLKKA